MTDKVELKSSHEVIYTVDVADVESIFQGKPIDPDILTVLMKDGKRLYCDEVCPIDSLQEEIVSEELEEEIDNYVKRNGYDGLDSIEEVRYIANHFAKWQKQQDQSTIELAEDHAMLAGMEKMKEQMMTKAVDAQCFGFQGAALFSFRLPADNYLVGSKVKVIVIKED